MKAIALLCLFCASQASRAQQSDSFGISKMIPQRFISDFSLFAGATYLFPSFYTPDFFNIERNSLLGYLIGVSATHSMKRFEIEGRTYFNRTRFEVITNYGTPPAATLELINDYVGFAIIPKYVLDHKNNFRIGIGSYYNFLQKSEQKSSNGYSFMGTTNSISYYESIDYGLLSSLSYQFNSSGNKSFRVEILYAKGFASVSNNNPQGYWLKRNNSLNILIHYNIKKTMKL